MFSDCCSAVELHCILQRWFEMAPSVWILLIQINSSTNKLSAFVNFTHLCPHVLCSICSMYSGDINIFFQQIFYDIDINSIKLDR